MPKVNQHRTVEWERILARRIKQEREARDWTMERLAQRMSEAGCGMHKSAIAKIESPTSGEKARSISLDEAVTFATVFGVNLNALLIDPGVLASKEALHLWGKHEKATEKYLAARRELEEIETRLLELVDSNEGGDVITALREHDPEARQVLYHAMVLQEHERAREGE
jgi:transcriptional regulator with XRE-family HTH domain